MVRAVYPLQQTPTEVKPMPRTLRPWAVLAGLLAMLTLATGTALAGGGHAATTIQSTIDGDRKSHV